MIKTLIVVGTRPEVIKMAPVVAALRARPGQADVTVCSTGQHRSLLDQMAGHFGLTIDVDLGLMREGQTPAEVAARAVEGMGRVIATTAPDWVLVQGDTTTAFAAAVAAFYARTPVAHVEAGLRTSDVWTPFPEEMNRRAIGQIASLHFAPTDAARAALLREGVASDAIHVVGNTVIDALLQTRRRIATGELPKPATLAGLGDGPLALCTIHRRESFDGGIATACRALDRFLTEFPDWRLLFPVHPNPVVREPVQAILGGRERAAVVEPLGYGDFVAALDAASLVVTDSGGLQEEAAALGKPIVVLREETERPEAVENGNAVVTGVGTDRVLGALRMIAGDPARRAAMSRPCTAFGAGDAGERIAAALLDAQPMRAAAE